MKREDKKILAMLVVAIILSSGIGAAIIFGSQYLQEEEDKKLDVKIFTDKTEGYTPYKINFSSVITNYDGKLKYYWEFGDGETSKEQEPSHTYTGNGSYVCTLKVTDSQGKKDNDSIVISSLINRAPRVSIDISDTNPSRKCNWFGTIVPFSSYGILRKSTSTMGGRRLYYLRQIGIAPKSNEKSDIQAMALVEDPEGDKIVSYKWELRPPRITLLGQEQIRPTYIYTGKNVTFNLLDTYVTGQYDLKLTVKDIKGNIDSEMTSFKVEKSQAESTWDYYKKAGKDFYVSLLSDFLSETILDEIIKASEKGYGSLPLITFSVAACVTLKLFNIKILTFNKIGDWLILHAGSLAKNFDIIYNSIDKTTSLIQEYPIINNVFKFLLSFIGVENTDILRERLGVENKRPVTSNPYPSNNSKFLDLNTSKVHITIVDPEGDNFNVRIFGEYINTTTNHDVIYNGVTNGTFSASLITPLPKLKDDLKYIYWSVEVIDPDYPEEIVKKTYRFSTSYE